MKKKTSSITKIYSLIKVLIDIAAYSEYGIPTDVTLNQDR
jgi:hypothetical protein